MKAKSLISVQQFCISHEVEFSFVNSLKDYGLIELVIVKEAPYIEEEHLTSLEKMIRMHYEMDINLEGIEAIFHLLQRADDMHEEIRRLKNRLRLYEDE